MISPYAHIHGGYLSAALGIPSLRWCAALRAGLPYGCATYCYPGRTTVLRRLSPHTSRPLPSERRS